MPQPIRHPELSAKLEEVRGDRVQKNKKYSMRYIAQDTGVDYGHINRVFHGQALPSRKVLINICKALDCSYQEAQEVMNVAGYSLSQNELEEERPSKKKVAA